MPRPAACHGSYPNQRQHGSEPDRLTPCLTSSRRIAAKAAELQRNTGDQHRNHHQPDRVVAGYILFKVTPISARLPKAITRNSTKLIAPLIQFVTAVSRRRIFHRAVQRVGVGGDLQETRASRPVRSSPLTLRLRWRREFLRVRNARGRTHRVPGTEKRVGVYSFHRWSNGGWFRPGRRSPARLQATGRTG